MGCPKHLVLGALLLLVALAQATQGEAFSKGAGGHATLTEMQKVVKAMTHKWKGKAQTFPRARPGRPTGCPEEGNDRCEVYQCQTNFKGVELYGSFLRARGKARADDLWDPENLTVENIREVREKVDVFMSHRPKYETYQSDLFADKGIVIVGGSGIYETPSWIAIHAIRRAGSELPIELWYPEEELPSCDRIEQLEQLGVRVRMFSELVDDEELKIEKFMLKIFALVFSSFQETMLLDSDVVAVQNPDPLFEEPLYREHGTLFWKDFWNSSSSPDFQSIFGEKTRVNYTHESGQMLVDKGRRGTWDALMLALYMNSYGPQLFYPLSVNYMGLGDKEILPLAILSLGQDYGIVEDGPDHVGLPPKDSRTIDKDKGTTSGPYRQWEETRGNTMMQHKPNGDPMFMHANLFKMSTNIPFYSFRYQRRWQVSLLHGSSIRRRIRQFAGVDLEMWCYDLVIQNHCLFSKNHKHWARYYIEPTGMFVTDHDNINRDLKIAKVLVQNGRLGSLSK